MMKFASERGIDTAIDSFGRQYWIYSRKKEAVKETWVVLGPFLYAHSPGGRPARELARPSSRARALRPGDLSGRSRRLRPRASPLHRLGPAPVPAGRPRQ